MGLPSFFIKSSKHLPIGWILYLCLLGLSTQAQITVEDIYTGAYRAKGMDDLQALPKGNRYAVLNMNRASRSQDLEVYDFGTRQKIETVLSTKDHPELADGIDDYRWDAQAQRLLVATHSQPIYRHSFTADYYVYVLATKKLTKVVDQAQEPSFSPDGSQVAYVKNNNLYVYNLGTGQARALTSDGRKNAIINGITDWVYEEEFSFVKAYEWSTDGRYIAFIRFDEREVPEFSMNLYGQALYPTVETFKYPKAGEKNSVVSLHMAEVGSGQVQQVALENTYTDFYIARLKWSASAEYCTVQVLNRHQNQLDLLRIDARTAQSQLLLRETDKAYVDVTDNLTFLTDNRFIWSSERSGFNHLYLHEANGKLIRPLTEGNWEVTALYGVDEKNKVLYYQSTETGSTRRAVYGIGLNGKNKRALTPGEGQSAATFSLDYSRFIWQHSSYNTPPSYRMCDTQSGKVLETIVSNEALAEKAKKVQAPAKTFMELELPGGQRCNAWLMKPNDFDPNQKYPLLMYQYSGPGSQEVSDSWADTNDWWLMALVQKGYIVACVDGRGTGYKGAAFKKCTQNQLGKYEVEDQIAAAQVLGRYPYIDPARIGIFGWSFGGFMASNCLFKGAEVFKMGIAVAPVTNWRYYDSIYTERYMQTPQENASGYDDNSPMTHAAKLKGKFLLIHGTADDNVHVQNSMALIEALVQANKNFDWAIYPDKNHGIYGGKTRIQLFNKMTQFILNNL